MIEGINLIFHSVKNSGGLERVILDLLDGFLAKEIKVRMISRIVEIDKNLYPNTEFIELKDKTPFHRLNDFLFNRNAMKFRNFEWKTISFAYVKGFVEIAGSGGNHKGYLLGREKKMKTLNDFAVIKTEHNLYKNAKLVVVHSDLLHNEVLKLYHIEKEKVITIYPPVDSQRFSLKARDNRQVNRHKFGFPEDKLVLLFPSNDHKRKGASLILSAIKKFNGKILLAVAGKKKLNGKYVINLGYCKNMPELYAAADCTILASNYEPFGLVGPESILCGTPVLLSKNIGSVTALTEEACFTFDRNLDSLIIELQKVEKKFNQHQLSIQNEPKNCIKYDVTIVAHIDKILKELEKL